MVQFSLCCELLQLLTEMPGLHSVMIS